MRWFLLLCLFVTPAYAQRGAIRQDELKHVQEQFQQLWGEPLLMKLADLPAEGHVPDFRIPYSGHDYPDRAGGTYLALSKYDRAFNRGALATNYEINDVKLHRYGKTKRPPLLFPKAAERRVPGWYGHCNGWTAAAIRHAEPQHSVTRNGVTFTPADIKGLLAELYMYSDSTFLGGVDPAINPAMLHLALANWLGRGAHPIAMEAALGEMVVNFPIHRYSSTISPGNPTVVATTVTYTLNIPREIDKGPANFNRKMVFSYALDLDQQGQIRGGYYLNGSQAIDMLWVPLKPTQGGQAGNQSGNPYLNVKDVLALWRDSVPEETRKAWHNIDPDEAP
jgi:hypothetical protein